MLRIATSHPADDLDVLDGHRSFSDIYLDPFLIKSYNEFERVGEKIAGDYATYLLGREGFCETHETNLRKTKNDGTKGDRFLAVRFALRTSHLQTAHQENRRSGLRSLMSKPKKPVPKNSIEHLMNAIFLGFTDLKSDNALIQRGGKNGLEMGDRFITIDVDIWNTAQTKIVQSCCVELSAAIKSGKDLAKLKDILSLKHLADRFENLYQLLFGNLEAAQKLVIKKRLEKEKSFLEIAINSLKDDSEKARIRANETEGWQLECSTLFSIAQASKKEDTIAMRQLIDGATEEEILQSIRSITDKPISGLDEITNRHLASLSLGIDERTSRIETNDAFRNKNEAYLNSIKESLLLVKEAVEQRMEAKKIPPKAKQQEKTAFILKQQEDGTITQTPINISQIISYCAGYDNFVGDANNDIKFDGIIPYGLFKNLRHSDPYKVKITDAITKLGECESFDKAQKLLTIIFPATGHHANEEADLQLQIEAIENFKSAFNKCAQVTKKSIIDNFKKALGALSALSQRDIDYNPENNSKYELMFKRAVLASELFGIDYTKYYTAELKRRRKCQEICDGLLELDLERNADGKIILGGFNIEFDSYKLSILNPDQILEAVQSAIADKQIKNLVEKRKLNKQSDRSQRPNLFAACKNGDLETVKKLIASGVKIDSKTNPALFIACQMGHTAIVEYLLNQNADYQTEHAIYDKGIKTSETTTPLGIACQKGHIEIVKMLCKRGGVGLALTKDTSGQTALHRACGGWHDKNLKVVQYLCAAYPSLVSDKKASRAKFKTKNQSEPENKNPLFIACLHNNPNIAKHLLTKGAKQYLDTPCRHSNKLFTPLEIAHNLANLEVVKILLEKGASISDELKKIDNLTDPTNLSDEGKKNLKQQLINACNTNSPYADIAPKILSLPINDPELFFIACQIGLDVVVDQLIINRNDINFECPVDKDTTTSPLGIACQNGHLKVVESIVAKFGLDNITKLNSVVLTPLLIACKYNHLELVKFLLEKGAEIDKESQDIVFSDASEIDPDIALIFINHLIQAGKNPFNIAIEKNYASMLKMLLSQSFEPDDDGKKALENITEESELKDIAQKILQAKPIVVFLDNQAEERRNIELLIDYFNNHFDNDWKKFIKHNSLDINCEKDLIKLFPLVGDNKDTDYNHFEIRNVEAFKKSWERIPALEQHQVYNKILGATKELLKLSQKDPSYNHRYKLMFEKAKKSLDIFAFSTQNQIERAARNKLATELDEELQRRAILQEIFILHKNSPKTDISIAGSTYQEIQINKKKCSLKLGDYSFGIKIDGKVANLEELRDLSLATKQEKAPAKIIPEYSSKALEVFEEQSHFQRKLFKLCTDGNLTEVTNLLTKITNYPSEEHYFYLKIGRIEIATLSAACYLGQQNIVQAIIEKYGISSAEGVVFANKADISGLTPLEVACLGNTNGSFKIVEYLLKNAQAAITKNTLAIACAGGNLQIVELLLKNGAMPQLNEKCTFTIADKKYKDKTPLEIARIFDNTKVADLLLQTKQSIDYSDPSWQKEVAEITVIPELKRTLPPANQMGRPLPSVRKPTAVNIRAYLFSTTIGSDELKFKTIAKRVDEMAIYPDIESVKDTLKNVIIFAAKTCNIFENSFETIEQDIYGNKPRYLELYQKIEDYNKRVGIYDDSSTELKGLSGEASFKIALKLAKDNLYLHDSAEKFVKAKEQEVKLAIQSKAQSVR